MEWPPKAQGYTAHIDHQSTSGHAPESKLSLLKKPLEAPYPSFGVRTHSHIELAEEPIMSLLQSMQKAVEHKGMLLLILFFDALSLWKSFVYWSYITENAA